MSKKWRPRCAIYNMQKEWNGPITYTATVFMLEEFSTRAEAERALKKIKAILNPPKAEK